MLRIIFFFLLFSFLLTACKKSDKSCPFDTYTYNFKNNTKVDTVRGFGQGTLIAHPVSGNKKVFIYNHSYTACPQVADGDWNALLLFEVDPSLNYFKFYTDDLESIKCYYHIEFAEIHSDAYIPVAGVIEGTRINDQKWNVNIDLMLTNDKTLKISAIFAAQ
jgi:hypothetical protein